MTTAKMSFENFADGAAIAINVGGGNGDTAFNEVQGGTGVIRHVTATNPIIGSRSARFGTGSTSILSQAKWIAAFGTQTSVWSRFYLELEQPPGDPAPTSLPATLRAPFKLSNSNGACFELAVTAGRRIRVMDISAATVVDLPGSTAIPFGRKVRIETYSKLEQTTGECEVRFFFNHDESAPTYTTGLLTGKNFRGASTTVNWGLNSAAANVTPFKLDGLAVSNEGWIGPEPGYINDPPTIAFGNTVISPGTGTVDDPIRVLKGWVTAINAGAADPESAGALTYSWAITKQPAGSTLSLSDQVGSAILFRGDHSGDYIGTVTATDITGKSTTATWAVAVLPAFRRLV